VPPRRRVHVRARASRWPRARDIRVVYADVSSRPPHSTARVMATGHTSMVVDAIIRAMLHSRWLVRRLFASAAFVPVVAAWALGGCNTTGFSEEACEAALAQCGYLYTPPFCQTTPSACTIGGKPYTDTRTAIYLPPNQTITIDISSVGLGERAVD